MLFSEAVAPADEWALQQLEATLALRLPPQYRAFLQQANGGSCRQRGLPIEHPGKGAVTVPLECFFSVGSRSPDLDLQTNYFYYRDAARIPPWFLPIAMDIGTNLIGLGLSDVTSDQVFYWDHEREFLAANGVFRIADGFHAFLRSIHTLY